MDTRDRFTIERQARELRRQEVSRLFGETYRAVTDWLRRRHEGALRRRPRTARMRSANATPA